MSYTRPQINRRGGEYRAKVTIGDITRIENEFYQPFGKRQRYFVEPNLQLVRGNSPFFDDGDVAVGTDREEFARIGLDAGVLLGRWGELRFGLRHGSSELESLTDSEEDDVGTENLSSERESNFFVRLTIDSLDELSWPHSGLLTVLSHTENVSVAGADLDYTETDILVVKPFTRGANTLTLRGAMSTSKGPDGEACINARLGGFLELSGFAEDELRGEHSLLLSGTFYRRVNPRSILFDLPIYEGGSLEAGNVFEDRDDLSLDGLPVASSAFVGLDSPIGPIYLGYGKNDQNADRFYLSIGSFFR